MDGRGRLEPDLEAALRMLVRPEFAVDSVWLDAATPDQAHRALAVSTRYRAVLFGHRSGSAEVTVLDVAPDALAGTVIATMPAALARTDIVAAPEQSGPATAAGVVGVRKPEWASDTSHREEIRWRLREESCEAVGPARHGRLLACIDAMIG
jgi:hypothetical protein